MSKSAKRRRAQRRNAAARRRQSTTTPTSAPIPAQSPVAPAPDPVTSLDRVRATPRADYDAVQDKGKRRAPRKATYHEDDVLKPNKRKQLSATLRDQRRNFTLAAWMVRLHLAHTCNLTFQATTRDAGYNRELETYIEERSAADVCDISGYHDLEQFRELMEASRIIDGDAFALKLRSGHMQGLEGDRIANPRPAPDHLSPEWLAQFTHGVRRNKGNRPKEYLICRHEKSRLVYDCSARAANVIAHGAFDRFAQGRGVSPLAAACNQMQDLYESLEFALLKAKMQHLFGMVIKRTAPEVPGAGGFTYTPSAETGDDTASEGTSTDDEDTDDETERYDVDLGAKPFKLELDPGDEVDTVETRHPSTEFANFTALEIKLIMLALDFPETYIDSRKGSYTIHKADRNRYLKLVRRPRRRVIQFSSAWAAWQIERGIYETRELGLPSGWTLRDVKYEWWPAGEPWLDASKEVIAATMACQMGFDSPQRICKERGLDWHAIIDQCAEAFATMRAKGLPVDAWSKSYAEVLAQVAAAPEGTS